jgi:transposase
MIEDAKSQTLLGIIRDRIQPDSIVYIDSFRSYDVLDVSEFHHVRINHSEKFAEEKNHINGIENFWNQAKRHMRRYNGIPKAHFFLFLKECEWRFNHRPASNLLKTISEWVKM